MVLRCITPAIRRHPRIWTGRIRCFGLSAIVLAVTGPVISSVHAAEAPQPGPMVVETTAGTVRGFLERESVAAFRGIPYAAPPVGESRWQPPQAPQAWNGVREATEFGPDCMQYRYRPHDVPMSEDCLYLNVYKPPAATAGDALPVHVWIYGGAFRSGAASLPSYDNSGDVRDGIVYVNFNYRVNVFGFMAHPGLTAESPRSASGNYGLMDQVAALQWVRDNIAKFGGDPENVTVSGVSAGASSIGYLLTSPLAEGLYRRALMESTAGWHPQRTLDQQEAWSTGRFGEDIDALRAMDAGALLALTAAPDGNADGTDTLGDGRSGPFSYIDWLPIVDGYVLPKHDRQAWKDGDFHIVDMLIGDNENEGLMFMQIGPPIALTTNAYRDYMRAQYGLRGDEALRIYPAQSDDEVAYQLGLATGDLLFQLPAREMARRMAERNPSVYRYHFTKHTASSPVALHGAEVPYFFGNLDAAEYGDSDRALSETMQRAKRRFIRTGDPTGGDLPRWPAYDESDPYMQFGDDGAVPGTGLRNEALDFAVEALNAKVPLE